MRVNEAGDKFPTSEHFKRKRRSLDEGTGNSTDHWASSDIHYRISAFGQNYHLNLTLDSGFIAPFYTVTILGVPGGDNVTDFATDGEEEEEEEDTELRHCFYKGHVNAQAEHAAVISLCAGLVSFYARSDCAMTVRPAALLFRQGYSGGITAYTRLEKLPYHRPPATIIVSVFQAFPQTCLVLVDRANIQPSPILRLKTRFSADWTWNVNKKGYNFGHSGVFKNN